MSIIAHSPHLPHGPGCIQTLDALPDGDCTPAFCLTCKTIDTGPTDALKKAFEWLRTYEPAPIQGIYIEEIAQPDDRRLWHLTYSIPITADMPYEDIGTRQLTVFCYAGNVYQAASGWYATVADYFAARQPHYTKTACWYCHLESGKEEWPDDTDFAICTTHAAIEVTCAACQGTGDAAPGSTHPCPTCMGTGHIITDPILNAAAFLGIPAIRTEKQGDSWLAMLCMIAGETRAMALDDWQRLLEDIAWTASPGFPWHGQEFTRRALHFCLDRITRILDIQAGVA